MKPKATVLQLIGLKLIAGLAVAFAPALSHLSQAAELSPYAPPTDRGSVQQYAPPRSGVIGAEFYLDFQRKALSLAPADRQELANLISDEMNRARAAGMTEKAQHYSRLLSILRSL